MPFVTVNHIPLTFRLRRSLRVKHLHLRALSAEFEIVAPLQMKNKDILAFMLLKRPWMFRIAQSKNHAACLSLAWPSAFLANETIPYRGNPLLLHIKYAAKSQIGIVQNALVITISHQLTLDKQAHEIKNVLYEWYHQETTRLVQKSLNKFCPLIDRWPQKVKIKQQKTRWGSCSPQNVITINWLLILAPEGVLEYVVLHELCHLFHRHHGARFWAKVNKTWPDFHLHQQWLKKNGAHLQNMSLK